MKSGVPKSSIGLFIGVHFKEDSGNVNKNLVKKFWCFQSLHQRFITDFSHFIRITVFPFFNSENIVCTFWYLIIEREI
jgi:hypothetical protein